MLKSKVSFPQLDKVVVDDESALLHEYSSTVDIQLALSELEVLGTGVEVVSGSEDAAGVTDVLDSVDSIEEIDDVGVVVVVGGTVAVEDVSVELITEDVGAAEVVVTATTLELESDRRLDGAMEEVVLGVVVGIELAAIRSVMA